MRKFWQYCLLTASGTFALIALDPPVTGEAKVITGNGLDAGSAVIYDSKNKVQSHTAVLPRTQPYVVKYKWSIPNWIKINSGDTMYFSVPLNVYVPADDRFPMKSLTGALTIGEAYVAKEAHEGTVTFNSVLSNTTINRSGYINLDVTGTGEEGGVDPEEPGGTVPGEVPGNEDDSGTEEPETPGTETPGTETPGTETPGTETPGTETPGTETPGTETPGTETPGTETPGTETPGTETPGINEPGETPGSGTGEPEVPGSINPPTTTTPTTPTTPESPNGNVDVPGVTYPGHHGNVTPGIKPPVISGGAGSYVTTGSGHTGTSQTTHPVQKPGAVVTQQHGTTTNSTTTPSSSSQSGVTTSTTHPSKPQYQQNSQTLPQTGEHATKGWVVAGLGLLGISLGTGLSLFRRKN